MMWARSVRDARGGCDRGLPSLRWQSVPPTLLCRARNLDPCAYERDLPILALFWASV